MTLRLTSIECAEDERDRCARIVAAAVDAFIAAVNGTDMLAVHAGIASLIIKALEVTPHDQQDRVLANIFGAVMHEAAEFDGDPGWPREESMH